MRFFGALLRNRAGGLKPRANLRCLGLSALIPCAALGGCGDAFPATSVECVNIVSHERLTHTNNNTPDEMKFGFDGIDANGFTRTVPRSDARWWKCRSVVASQ